MAKEQAPDFDLGFTPAEFDQLTPDQGVGFRNPKWGDYTLEIIAVETQETKNAKTPHVMFKPTFRLVEALDAENKSEVGSETNSLYGGPKSPDFMKKRMKALCVATGVRPGKNGGIKGSAFIGKRFDATLVWELSASGKLDDMGKPKYYVNVRVKGERKVGEERPKGLNPAAESAKAAKYQEDGTVPGGASGGDTPPWDTSSAGSDTGSDAAGVSEEPQGFIPEDEVDGTGHTYRAVYKLGGEGADDAKEGLISAGVDPEGEIKPDLIEDDEIKQAYLAKFAPKGEPAKKNGLPPMKPRTGTRPAARQ